MESEVSDSPALEAAREEHRQIATNPQHAKHAGYQRGDTAVSEYLDSLYRRAVPQTTTPSTATVPRNHAGEAAKAEHARIATDKAHPMYAGYHRVPMDPKVETYLSELYKNAYASPAPIEREQTLGKSNGVHAWCVRGGMNTDAY